MEMSKKLKCRLQLSFGMTAELEVCNLIGGIWETGFYHFSTGILLKSLPQLRNPGIPIPVSSPPEHTHLLTTWHGRQSLLWASLFLPEAPDRVRALWGGGGSWGRACAEGRWTTQVGRREEAKRGVKPGLDDAGSRLKVSTFWFQLSQGLGSLWLIDNPCSACFLIMLPFPFQRWTQTKLVSKWKIKNNSSEQMGEVCGWQHVCNAACSWALI